MSFYIILPSNVSPRFFPENRISSYKVKLPKRFVFNSDEYEVGMTEFTYVNSVKTFNDKSNRYVACTWYEPSSDSRNSKSFYLPNTSYSSVSGIIRSINQAFRDNDHSN